MALKGKKILLAISGGIAAYKMNYLVRDFVKRCRSKVILTPSAENFVTKVTLSTFLKMQFILIFMTKTEHGILM